MASETNANQNYVLDEQVGFLLRRVNQRHLTLFSRQIADLTPTQFAALARLCEIGNLSQNALGRATAMDAATIKGVVDRLKRKGYVNSTPDPVDQRRVILSPTPGGIAAFENLLNHARKATSETLAPLDFREQAEFLRLLGKLL